MKNQLKGIAVILCGILLANVADVISWDELALVGGLVGIIGLIVVFWNGDWKGET